MSLSSSVVLFGDSITEFAYDGAIAPRMAQYYTRRLDVINRGYAGYNTDWAIPVLKQIVASGLLNSAKLMTIWLGANDATLPGESQHVPLERYRSNMKTLISLVRDASPDTKLIIITPPPLVEHAWWTFLRNRKIEDGDPDPDRPTRSHLDVPKYVSACKQVAQETGLPVVDMHDGIVHAAGGSTDEQLSPYFIDGLHLSPKGYDVAVEGIKRVIAREYPALVAERMQMALPDWELVSEDPKILEHS